MYDPQTGTNRGGECGWEGLCRVEKNKGRMGQLNKHAQLNILKRQRKGKITKD